MCFRPVPAFKRIIHGLLWIGLSVDAAHAAAPSCPQLDNWPATYEIGQGLQTELRTPVPVTKLAVGDAKIADVQPSGSNAFILTGIAPGTTSLMVWTACSKTPRQSMVFVRGKATSALTSVPSVPSDDPLLPSQVQTDVRFVEVSRTKLKEASASIFGVRGNWLFGSPRTLPTIGGIVTPSIPVNNDMFNLTFATGSTLVAINALEGSGFAYTLARPSLVALSGQSASFLAGGEVPIPVPSSGSDNVSIEYKEFGIRLTLTPTIVGKNRIALKVAPEVSELDFTNAVSIAGTIVPALTVRRTDTSISLADGESFVISGLISTHNDSQVNKFPGLGDIPILGAFFRDSTINREERELLMIVTPHLVQPLAANAQLPSLPGEQLRNYDPNFYRMFFLENGDFDSLSGLSQ
ncbi:secretin [Pseudomonas laurylsulfativorans]|uniref:Secretin n=1 Tax=Pseudomonas laurylsulfativorans TaxID=1943631 RepID=A0A2S3VG41_9PSED|nr:type II and III secretion system protein family protein [Pseudomonas laurylsulfativorans]POF38928.1 secretin [Pseudomonas laurylsulfativorans]